MPLPTGWKEVRTGDTTPNPVRERPLSPMDIQQAFAPPTRMQRAGGALDALFADVRNVIPAATGSAAAVIAPWVGADSAAAERRFGVEAWGGQPFTEAGHQAQERAAKTLSPFVKPIGEAMRKVDEVTGLPISETARHTMNILPFAAAAREGAGLLRRPLGTVEQEVAARAVTPLEQGRAAGFKVKPSDVNPKSGAAKVEGLTSSKRLESALTEDNQKVTNRLVAEELGLDPAKPITEDAITAARRPHSAVYDEVGRTLGAVDVDDAYRTAIAALGRDRSAIRSNPSVEQLKADFGAITQLDAAQAMQEIRQLRADARGRFRQEAQSGDPSAGAEARALQQTADALEKLLERTAQARGDTDLIDRFREARQSLAKLRNIEDALDGENIDPRVFAKAADRGAPLTGNLKVIADFARSEPGKSVMRSVTGMKQRPGTTALESGFGALGGLLGGAKGAAAAIGTLGLRHAGRGVLRSDWFQNRYGRVGAPAMPAERVPVTARAAAPLSLAPDGGRIPSLGDAFAGAQPPQTPPNLRLEPDFEPGRAPAVAGSIDYAPALPPEQLAQLRIAPSDARLAEPFTFEDQALPGGLHAYDTFEPGSAVPSLPRTLADEIGPVRPTLEELMGQPQPPAFSPPLQPAEAALGARSLGDEFGGGVGSGQPFGQSPAMARLAQELPTGDGPFGPVFGGIRNNPEGAIDKLMRAKGGEVPEAYVRPDAGPIALVYGNSSMGLRHIASKRGADFLPRVAQLLREGRLEMDPQGMPRAFLVSDANPADVAVLRLDWDGREKTWVVTSYVDDQGRFAGGRKTSNTPATSGQVPGVPNPAGGNAGVVFSGRPGGTNVPTPGLGDQLLGEHITLQGSRARSQKMPIEQILLPPGGGRR